MPLSTMCVSILTELYRLALEYMQVRKVRPAPQRTGDTANPFPPLASTMIPITDHSMGHPGGYGDSYKYSTCSDTDLATMALKGMLRSHPIVTSPTTIPFVAEASGRCFNALLSMLVDALGGNERQDTR